MAHHKKYKIAIIGAKEAILGFKAFGFDIIPSQDVNEAVKKMFELKKQVQAEDDSDKYGVIFITEELARDIPEDDYRKLTNSPLPAIIAIPSHKGSTGFGMTRLKRIVERAVGSDILK